MKFGFELELFCREPLVGDGVGEVVGGNYVLVPNGLPYDECGWLVEIRSEPHTDIRKAIALLQAEFDSVKEQAIDKGIILEQIPLAEIPRDLKVQAARKHGKGLINYRNIYGYETHKNSTRFQTASVHVSFTDERTFHYENKDGRNREFHYPGFVDHAKLIVGLDKAFVAEIKAAKRNPGFYEIKGDGRIEYRSLPNNIDLNKLREVLVELTS